MQRFRPLRHVCGIGRAPPRNARHPWHAPSVVRAAAAASSGGSASGEELDCFESFDGNDVPSLARPRRRLTGARPGQPLFAQRQPLRGPVCRRAIVSVDPEQLASVERFYIERVVPSYARRGFLGASLLSDGGQLVNLSYWESREALEANNESDSYLACMQELAQLLAGAEPAISVFRCHAFHAEGSTISKDGAIYG
mmetsp:Transcript_8620/g.22286  ORF Transcript_8620/g.22286 Transcript_8620/m.22286 type:complete len:197 (+) Transcript_8620:44-634(+)